MFDCTVLGLSQSLDFESNAMTTYVALRLPDGAVIQAAVDEEAAATIMGLQVSTKGAPKPAPTKPIASPPAVRAPVPAHRTAPPAEKVAAEDQLSYEEPGEPANLQPTGQEGVFVFGGQDTAAAPTSPLEAEEAAALKEGSPTVLDTELEEPTAPSPAQLARAAAASVKAPSRSRVQKLSNGKLVVPSMTVQPLPGGYPAQRTGVDTTELTGGRDPDENGVGSV